MPRAGCRSGCMRAGRFTGNAIGELAIDSGAPEPTDLVAYWIEKKSWPKKLNWTEEADSIMESLLARKKSSSSLSRKSTELKEEKSAQYRDARYPPLLQTQGSYMDISELSVTDASKQLVRVLLSREQTAPKGTLFDDKIFVDACRNLENRNEARIIQDISRLIIPSTEWLALCDKKHKHLTENVNEM